MNVISTRCFAGTSTLNPGSDLVFTDVDLDFAIPFPPFDTAEALVEVEGRDDNGQMVLDTATVPVSLGDTRVMPGSCTPGDTTICALDDRFQVDVTWRDSTRDTGPVMVVPNGRFFDGGYFYFTNPDNNDLLVQLLSNCNQNNHFWVFAAATTNVEFTVTVTDTMSQVTRTYMNPLGTAAQAITDTSAFATCP